MRRGRESSQQELHAFRAERPVSFFLHQETAGVDLSSEKVNREHREESEQNAFTLPSNELGDIVQDTPTAEQAGELDSMGPYCKL